MLQSSGAKRAATSAEVEVAILLWGKKKFIKWWNREEADNMCKMMATSSYALLEHEDLGKSKDS